VKNGFVEYFVEIELSRNNHPARAIIPLGKSYFQENIAPAEAMMETREVKAIIQDIFFI